jgi:hypothetical protein
VPLQFVISKPQKTGFFFDQGIAVQGLVRGDDFFGLITWQVAVLIPRGASGALIYTVEGGGHTWPGGMGQNLRSLNYLRDAEQPFAGLALSVEKSETGRFVLIAGFPLESFNPAIQLVPSRATSMDELSVDSRTDEPHR